MIASRALALAFVALIVAVPLVQWRVNWQAGRSSLMARLFSEPPSAASLKSIEEELLDRSVMIATLRPISQWFQFHLFGDAGSQVLQGQNGWFFYRPGVEAAVLRGPNLKPLDAILGYHSSLKACGIDLLVVPVPNKESIYPDRLTATDATSHHWHELDMLFAGLHDAGVDTVDLRVTFAETRANGDDVKTPLYLKQDTHWSPSGLELAARAIANVVQVKLSPSVDATYATKFVPLERHGDLLEMLRVPKLLQEIDPETITAHQVLNSTGEPIHSELDSRVLLLGDSFLRIFESDDPGSAGFPAHLARMLGEPVTTLVADGGASTLVRQDLYRRSEMLLGKRLVIWEFIERDLRLGTEGWQMVPLPPL